VCVFACVGGVPVQETGSDMNMRDRDGCTALFIARSPS
jgi:hypothetical protein